MRTSENPYPGLRPFRPDEDHLFFGRENQVNAMVDKLARTRFLAVVGSSGSGKSSLVNCGLRPALHRGLMAPAGTSWRVAQFRPGGSPIRSLAKALASPSMLFDGFDAGRGLSLTDTVDATLRMSSLGLVDMFEQARLPDRTNLLVVADQFEELFRYRSAGAASADQSMAFVNLLLSASAQGNLPIYVVLTMRSDFLGDAALIPNLPEAINDGQYLVPRMNRDELRSAIVGPARVAGGDVTPVLCTRLVNDVGVEPDQLSLLQHALNRTWSYCGRERPDASAIDLVDYEAIGTMSQALDRHAERAYAELPDGRPRRLCELIFKALTDRGTDARGVRRPTSMRALCDQSGATASELGVVIDVFRKPSRSFLMPPATDPLEPDTILDISHESLMRVWRRLMGWVESEAEDAARFRRLAESAALSRDGRGEEMAGAELALTLKWWQDTAPTETWAKRYAAGFELAKSFLERSRERRDREARAAADALERSRHRRRAAVAVAVIVVVAGLLAAQYLLTQTALRAEADASAAAARRASSLAQDAAEKAEEARRLAEFERDRAVRTAEAATQAVAELADIQRLTSLAEGSAQSARSATQGKNAKQASEYATARDDAKREAEQKLGSAQKRLGTLAAISAGGMVIDPSRVSLRDLFDVSRGVQVTGWSGPAEGRGRASAMFGATPPKPPQVGMVGSGGVPSDDVVTFFEDGKKLGFLHWIEFKVPQAVPLRSVALFARHDPITDGYRFRRSISAFRFYAQGGSGRTQIVDYTPSLPYGAGDEGVLLAVCLPIDAEKVANATTYRAEFQQGVDVLGRWSAPRIVQLDGYETADCRAPSTWINPTNRSALQGFGTNGFKVGSVTFGDGSGKTLGYFRQSAPARWVETGPSGTDVRFQFTESNRDEWSVYLADTSRNMRLQLDLHTRKVSFAVGNGASQDLYLIVQAQ